ncbi:hypothetical protein SteCoe_16733 [Stentor coeruleus]|uniref:Uncharacterized protein n=1 Tax=Stentor coeruleus TaxID=5963 RepID=A0A1R2C0N0_9CILI|nr:hypothetical protein SteCoe_16733 [Stentor coeruleus]
MKGRSPRPKVLNKSVKVSAKKASKKKTLKIPKVSASPGKKASLYKDQQLKSEIKENSSVESTPMKGFRLFEQSEGTSKSITPIKSDLNENSDSFFPNPRIKVYNERQLGDNTDLAVNGGSHPEVWSRGIENVTYTPTDFDFPSFPIQY